MKKLFLTLLFSFVFLAAKEIGYQYELNASANVTQIVVKKDTLFAATDNGIVDIFDWKGRKKIGEIKLPKIHDFMGDIMGAKVLSIDVSDDKKEVLILAQAEGGGNNLYLYKDNNLTKLIDKKDISVLMNKVRFLSKDKIFIVSLSSEIVLYDLKSKKPLYIKQLSESSFGDFCFNEDKTKAAVSCESGEIFIVNVEDGKVLKVLSGANKDKVFKVDYKKGKVLGGGQDRQASIYDVASGSYKVIKANFLVYAVGLSPNADLAAICYDENNEIGVFDTNSLSIKYLLKGQKSTLNTILFIDENTLISSSDDSFILVWKLK